MNLVSIGALNALRWCKAGESVNGKEGESKVYSSEEAGFRLMWEKQN